MPPENEEKLNRLEEFKKKLWSKESPTKIEHRDTMSPPRELHVPESWGGGADPEAPERFFLKTSFFKKFFFFSLAFFVLAIGYASYMFFVGNNTVSAKNIDIFVQGSTFIGGGEELPLTIEIANRNNSSLEQVDLIVEYAKSSAETQNVERQRQTIGTISAGGKKEVEIKAVIFGEQGSVRPIRIAIEYRVEGSNAIFIREKIYEVTISSTPVDLAFNAPTDASSNQDFSFELKVRQNATEPLSGMLLKLHYPPGFQFGSAVPAPTFGNDVWNLGDLSPGAESKIAVSGKMLDVFPGEEKVFRASVGLSSLTNKDEIEIALNSSEHSVTIEKSSVEARLYINGAYNKQSSVGAGSSVAGEIRYANNLETSLRDVQIRAKLSGSAYGQKGVEVRQGFYNSVENLITWDKNSLRELSEVNPGEQGSVEFSFFPLPLYSSSGLIKDPAIDIEVSVSGISSGTEREELTSRERQSVRIASELGFAARALYYSGPLKNKGPIPPKVGQETTYTILWSLTNTANNVSNATIRTSLPPWSKFLGPIAPENASISYDASTKEIVWNVGEIPRGAGITGADITAAFQVSFTPSLSQVGTAPTLVNDAVLTGHDDFANVNVRVNKASLNTRLGSDPSFPPNGDRVVE